MLAAGERLRQRTLTPKRGYRGRLDELSGGAEAKMCTSDHENHHQSCQKHNGMRDRSPGEEKHALLATTQVPSISNNIDFIGW